MLFKRLFQITNMNLSQNNDKLLALKTVKIGRYI